MYDQALRYDPSLIKAHFGKGCTLLKLKYYKYALAIFEQATRIDPSYIEDYTRATQLDPNFASAYHSRGIAYDNLKEYQRAIEDYSRAIQLDPHDASAYYNRGIAYGNLEDYQRAIEDFTRAIELDPNDALAYHNRGIAYGNLKEDQRTIEDFNRAIQLDPNLALAYNNRGIAYRNLKEDQRAIEDYSRAIQLDPNFALAYNNRGLSYLWLKNMLQAKNDYSHCYELDSTDIKAAWMSEWVGLSKQRVGRETAARLEAIAIVNPPHYIACICRGVASGLRGKVKEGLEEIERAILLDPEEWDAYFWKGMLSAYYYRGRFHIEETRAAIEQSLTKGLPPILLTPLYWLEKDLPDVFVNYAKPLLLRYEV